jgi:hypothetical protein
MESMKFLFIVFLRGSVRRPGEKIIRCILAYGLQKRAYFQRLVIERKSLEPFF